MTQQPYVEALYLKIVGDQGNLMLTSSNLVDAEAHRRRPGRDGDIHADTNDQWRGA